MANSKLYIFNPENDLALAYGRENYTAPPFAAKLRNDLQMLPVWYASGEGADYVYSTREGNAQWLSEMSELFGINVGLITDGKLANYHGDFSVWGWSADMRKRLLDRGVEVQQLPSVEQITRLRELSHRSISITFHKRIGELMGGEVLAPVPVELTSLEEVVEFASRYPACYIKAPWSSSGRGVYRVLERESMDFRRWCSGIIARQGSIMCEVPLENLGDFAMEFYCEGGVSRFVGYSLFKNSKQSAFDYGYVTSQVRLRDKLLAIIPDDMLLTKLEGVVNMVVAETIAPHYTGYLGVDMMVYNDNGVKRINPAVEINLRSTMGVLTTVIGERYISANSEGIYRMEYHRDNLKAYARRLEQEFPLVVEDGRIRSGVLMLTPIYTDTAYCAYIKVLETL